MRKQVPRLMYKKDSGIFTEINWAPWGRDESLERREVTGILREMKVARSEQIKN